MLFVTIMIVAISAMMAGWFGPVTAHPAPGLALTMVPGLLRPAATAAYTAYTAAATAAVASGIEEFLVQENGIAFQGILDNIGPNGSLVPGAPAGMVQASPSTHDPDCKFPCIELDLSGPGC